MLGMKNRRFWQNDFPPQTSASTARTSAERLLKLVRPAIEHLEACKKDATVNANLLDHFLLGARRMELIGQRMLDGLEAVRCYTKACETGGREALPWLDKLEVLVQHNRDAHEALGKQFAQLWLAESKPYALAWTMDRYKKKVKWYDTLAGQLVDARKKAEAGTPLPPPKQVGLTLPEGKK